MKKKYNEALDKMSGKQRLAKTISLYNSVSKMLKFQVSKEFTNLNEQEIKIKVAEYLYLSDNSIQKLLKKASVS